MQYSYVRNNDTETLSILTTDGLKTIVGGPGGHPQFEEIFTALRAGEFDDIENLISPVKQIAERFERVSDRVVISNGHVLFDGDPLNNTLTDQIVRFHREDSDFMPLVNFLEKLMQNKNPHSREHLYRWLDAQKFTIAPDGDIIGYKGVTTNLTSVHSGYGLVRNLDSQEITEYKDAHLPNNPNTEISMPRSMVTFDPSDGCSFGLHVGTWSYASGFGDVVLEVRVDPRDVVSVPTDCSDRKMRVCRYVVVGPIDKAYDSALGYNESFDDPEYGEPELDEDEGSSAWDYDRMDSDLYEQPTTQELGLDYLDTPDHIEYRGESTEVHEADPSLKDFREDVPADWGWVSNFTQPQNQNHPF